MRGEGGAAVGTRWSTFHDKFLVEERFIPATVRRNLFIAAFTLMGLGIVFFVVVLSSVLTDGGVTVWDEPVKNALMDLRGEPLTTIMIVLTIVFGPVALPIIILVFVVVWGFAAKHVWRPALLAGAMATGVLFATVIANTVKRDRPPDELMLIGQDDTFSFPSGHVLGAYDFLIITTYLFVSRSPTTRKVIITVAIAFVGIVAQIFSRMYLGYHWLSDTLGSLSLSLLIVGAVLAIDTVRTSRVEGEKVSGPMSKVQTDGT